MSAEDYRESDEKWPARYRRLVIELERARNEAPGGELSVVEEARRIDEIDRVWWSMTNAEQEEYGRDLREMARLGAVAWLAKQAEREQRPGLVRWLSGRLTFPRWVLLAVYLIHVVLMFTVGRLSR